MDQQIIMRADPALMQAIDRLCNALEINNQMQGGEFDARSLGQDFANAVAQAAPAQQFQQSPPPPQQFGQQGPPPGMFNAPYAPQQPAQQFPPQQQYNQFGQPLQQPPAQQFNPQQFQQNPTAPGANMGSAPAAPANYVPQAAQNYPSNAPQQFGQQYQQNPTQGQAGYAQPPTAGAAQSGPATNAYPSNAPQQPAQGLPTNAPTYTAEQIGKAGSQLVDAGRIEEVRKLFADFGVKALTELDPPRLAQFAMALKGLGANF